jgi:hypothetical protein
MWGGGVVRVQKAIFKVQHLFDKCGTFSTPPDGISYLDQPRITKHRMSTKALEGYSVVDIDGQRFLVPDFAVDEVVARLSAEVKRKEMGADDMIQDVCKPRSF